MKIYENMERLWTPSIETRVCNWAIDVSANLDKLKKAKRSFHQWGPLKVYISTSAAKKRGNAVFSIRYCGQEVAELAVDALGNATLEITPTKDRNNRTHFHGYALPLGSFEWKKSLEARKFRRFFEQYTHRHSKGDVAVWEHLIESHMIQEMKGKTKSKFGGKLSGIQPVLLNGNIPFQMPIPFSASKGYPAVSNRGNIDILSRREGRKLSVWELKVPGKIDQAVAQSYIYAVALIQMLRAKCLNRGSQWSGLLGFKKLPVHLQIEAVVVISQDKKLECQYYKQVAELLKNNPLIFKKYNATIQLCVAFYNPNTFALKEFRKI